MKDENNDEFIIIFLKNFPKILKSEFKQILLVICFFIFISILYIINSTKEYISVGKILPEISYKPTNGMGGLYEMLKKYNGNTEIYNTEITKSDLYDEIIKTNEFYQYIIAKEVKTIHNKKVKFENYYDSNFEITNHYLLKDNSKSKIKNKLKQINLRKNIEKRITITSNKKNNLITISVKMPDPSVAADIANYTITYLIEYITKYRTEKARKDLYFIENLLKNISKDSTKNEAITKEIRNNLLASTFQMKIKIQEDTPNFQVLEQAQIPVNSNQPSTLLIIIAFIIVGFLIGIIIAFLSNKNYKLLISQIKN